MKKDHVAMRSLCKLKFWVYRSYISRRDGRRRKVIRSPKAV